MTLTYFKIPAIKTRMSVPGSTLDLGLFYSHTTRKGCVCVRAHACDFGFSTNYLNYRNKLKNCVTRRSAI